MKLDSKTLPDNIRRCMPAETRKKLKCLTDDELNKKQARSEELELHRKLHLWLGLNGVMYVHSRTDKRPTIASGHPDFTLLYGGRACLIEAKGKGGTLRDDQIEKIAEAEKAKVPVLVSHDFAECIAFASFHLFGITLPVSAKKEEPKNG